MKKSHRAALIITVLCAVIIIAVALALIFAYRESSSGNADNTDSGESTTGTSIGDVQSEAVTLNGDSVIIKYPVLETDDGSEKADMINSLLREAALQKLYDQYLTDENGEFTYDITDTTLYKSSGVISSVSKGSLHAESAAHDYFFTYTVNIDEDTGEIYTFPDIITDTDSFRKAFLDGNFTPPENLRPEVEELGLEYFMNQCREEYGIYPDIYLDGDKLGVIFEVPYAVGCTAIFTIDKSDLGDILAPKFK